MTAPNRTRSVAEFVAGTSFDDLPAAVVDAALAPVADTIGALYAGYSGDAGQVLLAHAARTPALPERAGRIVGAAGLHTTPVTAALVNGALGHALDFDDVLAGFGHPSAPLLAALLALPVDPLPGRSLIEAYVLGHEVTVRIAEALGPRHYTDGWHTTCTAGGFGATAAVGKLMGLTADELTTAFGIVASMSSGIQRNFGTMTKPVQAGIAARNGVLAAELAREGLTASTAVLEGRKGFLDVYSDGAADPTRLDELGHPFALVDPGTSLKKYACCYETHRALDAVLEIQQEHRIDPGDLEAIICRVPEGDMGPLLYSRPRTALEAKFSMEYTLASAFVDGRITLATFAEEAVHRTDVRRVMELVDAAEDPENRPEDPSSAHAYPGSGGFVEVVVRAGGQEYRARSEAPSGSPSKPLTDSEIAEKFADCLSVAGIDATTADATLAQLLRLSELDNLNPVLAALPGPASVIDQARKVS